MRRGRLRRAADAAEDRAGDDLRADLEALEDDVLALEAEDLGEVGAQVRAARQVASRPRGAAPRRRCGRRVGRSGLANRRSLAGAAGSALGRRGAASGAATRALARRLLAGAGAARVGLGSFSGRSSSRAIAAALVTLRCFGTG